ncbi:hypothetical protein LX32DRAFT_683946 [Colletotrichum zoysiae]|uniref:Uncharacterized protein n=1 Tax=Colletotrichum zoysiae TaxID=1216348 RepID=A0AAD9M303_9PEZI|nr:hypothetical protein LX32DRAFT_683946 [Colletotrichum zoysiae]
MTASSTDTYFVDFCSFSAPKTMASAASPVPVYIVPGCAPPATRRTSGKRDPDAWPATLDGIGKGSYKPACYDHWALRILFESLGKFQSDYRDALKSYVDPGDIITAAAMPVFMVERVVENMKQTKKLALFTW